VLTKLARIGMGLAAMVLAGTTFALAETSATPASTKVAQASPAPTATPNPFSYRGYVRAYDFTRQNAYNGPNGTGKVNQQSFNAALSLHGDYNFGGGFDIGASYLYANPLSNCTTAVSHLSKPCGTNTAPNTNPDDTLPGYELSTLYEAYLQYKNPELYLRGGNVVTPGTEVWTPASDSRLKPAAFQGVYGTYLLNKSWTIEAADYWQWECRSCSAFDKQTLLTDNPAFPYPGANGLAAYYFDPARAGVNNSGVAYGRVGYTGPKNAPLTANLSYYGFNNIANEFWLDARYPFAGKLKPYVAAQFGSEGNPSGGIVGKISATVFGLQGGLNVLPNVQLVGGFDTMPWHTDTLPATGAGSLASLGITCSSTHQITVPSALNNKINLPYFLPSGGTAQCTKNADGTTAIYYGGWASPYTDSYATDPFFTTDLTQGMVDRRSAGTSFKLQATFTSNDKRLVAYLNHAWYDYNNGGYANSTQETNFDTLYYFNALPKTGTYHGFLFRYRYGERNSSPTFGPQVGLFKYNRFQAEYDF
jgi:hypothetical protein